ncbi:MAG TPA: ribose 5-phosphate isomerase B [Terriglobales bacterium]|nr:ribose 5-phosphate isomerase B [Terriglobales bacterium]
MKISIGSDHAGFPLKQEIVAYLSDQGHDVIDLGTDSIAPVDYPDYAEAVGKSVLEGTVQRAILICGSGVGASVAANKMPGIRAGMCHDTYSAHQGVEHDNMNVLVLGARVIGVAVAKELVDAFMKAEFTKEERHVRRLKKVLSIESRYAAAEVRSQIEPSKK